MTQDPITDYELKYRKTYEMGVPFVSRKGFDPEYEAFLREQPTRGRLIEYGCGEGFAANLAGELGYKVTALDGSLSAISKAKETFSGNPNVKFLVADVVDHDDLEQEASFQIAANFGCLHMITEDDRALSHLRNAYKALQPGGLAYFQNLVTPDEAERWFPDMREMIGRWRQRIQGPGETKIDTHEVDGRIIEVEAPRLGGTHRDVARQVALFTAAGFRVARVTVKTPGVNSPFEALVVARRSCVS